MTVPSPEPVRSDENRGVRLLTSDPAPRRKILIAVDGPERTEWATTVTERLFGDADTVVIDVEATKAATMVMEAAHEQAVDVIVVAAHDRSWFARLFDPASTRHLMNASDLPVLSVREPAATAPTARVAGDSDDGLLVMVAADGSASAVRAAQVASALFGPSARYEVVHVAPERPDPNADASGFAGPLIDDEEADEIERETLVGADGVVAAAARAIGPVPITETVVIGDPAHDLCARANEVRADVLVMGSSGLSGLLHVLLGSVSEHVLTHCDVPVLVVPRLD